MLYYLNETDLNQLRIWFSEINEHYSESDAEQLTTIVNHGLVNGYFEESEIYLLLDLLPRIIPEIIEEEKIIEIPENSDWSEYSNEQAVQYKRNAMKLRQLLSNMIFLQSAVHRRIIDPDKKTLSNSPGPFHGQGH